MARTRTLQIIIAGDSDKLTRELKKANRGLDSLGKQTKLTGSISSKGFAAMRVGAAGAVAAVGGLTLAIKGSVGAASDINESLAKNSALFGRYAKGIEVFSKTTADSLGVSRREALAAAGTFGGLFDALDIGQKQSAGMSKRLVTLAADLASFNNASPEEALAALRSGLSGEAEPMRRFNAFLSEGRVKLEAYKSGLAKSGAELTEKQKIQARYNLILKDTTKAQGDFARTSDQDANQTRILKAQYADMTAELGGKLLPVKLKVTKAINKFVDEMQSGTGQGGRFVDTMKDIWSSAKPIITGFLRAGKAVAQFTSEHPGLAKLAFGIVGVGAAVKTLKFVSAVTGFSALLKGGSAAAKALKPIFARGGTAAGKAVAGNVAASTASNMGPSLDRHQTGITGGKGGGRWAKFGKIAGRGFGLALVAGILIGYREEIAGAWEKIKRDFSGGNKPGRIDAPDSPTGSLRRTGEGMGRKGAGDVIAGLVGEPGGGSVSASGLAPAASRGLSVINRLFGGVRVSSGRRSAAENARVGGAPGSDHLTGNALDLVPMGDWSAKGTALLDRIAAWARKSPMVRWIGWRGVPGHGPGDHLHLSFKGGAGRASRGGPSGTGRLSGDVVDKLQAYGGKIRGIGDVVGKGRMTFDQVARLAESVGLPGVTFAQIAKGESGFNPRAVGNDPGGTTGLGLWQITTKFNDDIIKRFGGREAMFDPRKNAQAAAAIYKRQGIKAWYGTKFVTGANLHYKGSLAGAGGSSPSGRSAGGGGSSGGGGGGGGSSADRSASQEKSGSRLVNKIAARFAPGISKATKSAASLGVAIEDAGTAYGQLERKFGQSDEDLGTKGGRDKRLSEIAALKVEKGKQLAQQKKRAAALKTAISKTTAQLKALEKARKKAKGRKRAKMNERIRAFHDRLVDLTAELKALGVAITDTQLDIGDLDKDAADVAGTPDTEPEAGPSATDKLGTALSDIDLQEKAGVISPEAANAQRTAALQSALSGGFGALDQRQQWEVMGQLRDAQQAATEAQQAATQAANELAAATNGLRDEMAKSNAIATSSIGIQLRQATRALGDLLSGELGGRVAIRATMPGSGQLSRL